MPALNFQKQFAEAVERGEKRQTIRAIRKDKRQPAKRGDVIALYTGMRTKSCRKLMDATCTNAREIYIDQAIAMCDDGWARDPFALDAFAMRDGFRDWRHLLTWFEATHGLPFKGWLIEWAPETSLNNTPKGGSSMHDLEPNEYPSDVVANDMDDSLPTDWYCEHCGKVVPLVEHCPICGKTEADET